jgi:hypothetical protein
MSSESAWVVLDSPRIVDREPLTAFWDPRWPTSDNTERHCNLFR